MRRNIVFQNLNTFIYLSLAIVFASCSGGSSKPSPEQEAKEELARLEKEAFSNPVLDLELGAELLKAYKNVLEFELTPELLFKAGEVAYNMPDREDVAMEYFKRLSVKFATDPKAPHSLFYQGLIYENRWNDKEMAAETWERFLVRYPGHELAKDAADLLTLARDTTDDLLKVQQWLRESQKNAEK
jgi:tetratricopeptide (TPR) repeat protein